MFFLKMMDSKTKETLYYQGKKSSGSSLEMVSGSYASLKSAKEAARRFLKHCDDLLLERDIVNVVDENEKCLWSSM